MSNKYILWLCESQGRLNGTSIAITTGVSDARYLIHHINHTNITA